MYTELLCKLSPRKAHLRQALLAQTGLQEDNHFDTAALIWEDDTLLATGCRKGNLLKCIAVSPDHQGEGLTATLLTQLQQEAFSQGHRHLFLYTKPKNRLQFSSLFFYPVAQTQDVLLMENRRNGLSSFLDTLPPAPETGTVGAAVMNCNPFTKGHRYLIETAASRCDHLFVFVLSEDGSRFSPVDRLMLVKEGTKDLPNVTVLPTGPYLISSATFPTYFLKERDKAPEIQCLLDIEIFARSYAPRLRITKRFVGTEPLSPMTNQYNAALKANLPSYGIAVEEIPRLEMDGTPISASALRSFLDQGNVQAAAQLVPQTTLDYLKRTGQI